MNFHKNWKKLESIAVRGFWTSFEPYSSGDQSPCFVKSRSIVDRVNVVIPFCEDYLRITVFIDKISGLDIIFNDDGFPAAEDLSAGISSWIPTLATWKTHDLASPSVDGQFLQLLCELMVRYRKYAWCQIAQNMPRCVDKVCEQLGSFLGEGSVEVRLATAPLSTDKQLQLLLKLPVVLPEHLPVATLSSSQPLADGGETNPGPPVALLLLRLSPSIQILRSRLWMSPRLDAVVSSGDGSPLYRLPQPPKDRSNVLPADHVLDYVQLVARAVQHQVDMALSGHHQRRQLLSALLARYGRRILHYDPVHYSSIVLVYGNDSERKTATSSAKPQQHSRPGEAAQIISEKEKPTAVARIQRSGDEGFCLRESSVLVEVCAAVWSSKHKLGVYVTSVDGDWSHDVTLTCSPPHPPDNEHVHRYLQRAIDQLECRIDQLVQVQSAVDCQ